jgi:hypothetical protein
MPLEKLGKSFAVFSALLLGGCYVGYRALEQATVEPDVREDPHAPTVLPGSKNPGRMTVLPSSKSIDAVFSRKRVEADNVIPGIPQGSGVTNDDQLPLLPGSKIGTILKPEDAETIDRDKIDAILEDRESEPAEDTPPP